VSGGHTCGTHRNLQKSRCKYLPNLSKSLPKLTYSGIVSNRRFGGESRFTLLECGAFWARCGFAHNSVLGTAFSKTQIAPDSA
jgi:hypothetical protein